MPMNLGPTALGAQRKFILFSIAEKIINIFYSIVDNSPVHIVRSMPTSAPAGTPRHRTTPWLPI